MTAIEVAIEELKKLPSTQQEEAVQFIHELGTSAKIQKEAILSKLAGCINEQEAEEWQNAVNECREVEHEKW